MSQEVESRQSKGSRLSLAQGDAGIGLARVAQTTHGFSEGDVVRETALDTYTKAQADSEANIGVGLAFVFDVLDVDNFSIIRAGSSRHVGFAAHGLAGGFGTKLYLSQDTAGLLTVTEPATGFILYCGYIASAGTIGWEPGTITFQE